MSACNSRKGAASRKMRLDDLLVEQGIFTSREEVLRAVIAREVRVNDVYVSSAAVKVSPDANIFVRGRKRFVSRGGHKLQGALDAFGQDVRGLRCIDIGSSTGGFTDCLLQAGAAQVTCVDVGYGILAWKLQQDPRVCVFERTNIKLASPRQLGAPFDLLVADLSFIGLADLAPVFARLCKQPLLTKVNGEGEAAAVTAPDTAASVVGDIRTRSCAVESAVGTESTAGDTRAAQQFAPSVLIALVKPQFESAQGETDRGIVRDEAVRLRTVAEVRAALEAQGFRVTGTIESPITGAAGNVEYLVRAEFVGEGTVGEHDEIQER